MKDKVLSLISIAAKSGNVASGEFMTEKSVKEKKSFLVIVSEEASDATKKKFTDMCSYHKTEIRFYATKDDLGRCIGKEFRASLSVNDEGLANALLKKIDMNKSEGDDD